jgi:flavin-dependent dehydrogenase
MSAVRQCATRLGASATAPAATVATHRDAVADVVVVGASFGGVACALAAAQLGLRVCVLERKRDPGAKLRTTGIVVKEAAEATFLNAIPAPLVRRVEQVRLYSPRLQSLGLAAPGYYFLTTDTPNILRWLAAQLTAHGVDLRLGCAFTGGARTTNGWRVDGIGATRYLVGADGARSRVARHCGLGEVRDFLYGIEYEFPGAQLANPEALHCFLSRRFAPGYLGWFAQSPTGVQAGLALRHDPAHARVPDIDGFLLRAGAAGGLPRMLRPGTVRAGLIPCGGPVRHMARDGAILTGDAAGIVSPVTAGGIHSAWEHGFAVGEAIAARLRDGGPPPEQVAIAAAPRFRTKRALRWAFDHFQWDWPFDLLLHTRPLRWAAEQVYFRVRGPRPA